jgi:acid phosphatase type 7
VVTLAVDGDIAQASLTARARDVAALVTSHVPAVSGVLLGGDNARYGGTGTLLAYYQTYWQPAGEANWGQFDGMAFPQSGNHEYIEADAQGYFSYFADRLTAIAALPGYSGAASTVGKGWYSVNIAGWHIVSLNSNCASIGGCQAGSEQESWLAADLAAHAGMPIIAVTHAPRYTCGGGHTDATELQAMWADLYAAHADFVFSGHNHFYQRWKPLDATNPEAVQDDAAGITEIIAGSGGVSTYAVCAGGDPRIASQLGGDAAIGVLFLTISSDGAYSYEYQLRSNGSIFDSDSGVAHNAP